MLSATGATALALALTSPVFAQDDAEEIVPGPWLFGATTGLNLSQSSFSSNWSGGDQGSINWVLNADLKAERQFSETFNLSNLLQLAYGQTNTQRDTDDGRKWGRPQKTTDLILFESVGRFNLDAFVEPYASFRFDSQFRDESDPIGNINFNPKKFTESAGIARVLHKTETEEVITRLGFGFRQTVAKSFTDLSGETTESFSTNDGGFEWQTQATLPLHESIQYQGKLLVFLPIFYSLSDALKEFDTIAQGVDSTREEVQDFWRTPDVNFQNTFTAQVAKLIAVNLYVQWVYDKFDSATNVDTALDPALLIREVDGGIRKAGQFKQTLALGLTYKLF